MRSPRPRHAALLAAVALTIAGTTSIGGTTPIGGGLGPRPAAAATPVLTRTVEYLRAGSVNPNRTIDQAMSSPALADVTGDGVVDLVVGAMDGTVTVLAPADGRVLRYVVVQAGAAIQGAPTLVDVTGDGVRDVVVGTVRNQPGQSHVKIYDMVPATPRLVFDRTDSGQAPHAGFFGAPVVGDIDGDGAVEVVATNLDHRLHAWELNGAVVAGFPLYTYDTTLSSPALADVDRDGALDIVFGADMDAVNQPLPPGGYLWVVRGNGTPFAGYPLHLSGEVIWSSPAVGDLDGDGDLDAVVGTGRNFGHADQRKLYGVDLRSSAPLAGWPVTLSGNTMGSPALADLDGDGRLEVVTITGDGNLHRVGRDGRVAWTTCVNPDWLRCGSDTSFVGSPVVADVDDDAAPEVVVVVNRELLVVSATGAIEHRETTRSNPGDFAWPAGNAPAVARIGTHTYIASAVQVDNGDERRADGDRLGVYVWSSNGVPATVPWGQFHRDAAHSGTIDNGAPIADLGSYVDAAYRDLLGRAASADERSHWAGRIRGGLARGEFTRALARSSEWTGVVIDRLYAQVFGRGADAGGRAYWSGLVSGGLRVSEVAAHFYGSDEWYHRSPPTGGGGTVEGYIDNLYRRILGREPDGSRTYWYDQVRAGTPRKTTATAFYLSHESNARRVDGLYRLLLDRASDGAGRKYWADRFATIDDIELAAFLTASDEYFGAHS